MKSIILPFFLCLSLNVMAQNNWLWQQGRPMIERVSNNAVTQGLVNNIPYVYSFGGIDSTKIWSGIHLRSFRYNTQADTWETIPALPDTMGKIAAGASTIKNKIYIMGGYHVFSDGHEISSDKVHIYNPETNSYLADGSPIPVPIDDHVQAVWRDSLIYVVSGWSNNGNVANVQIYNPSTDTWSAGTPVPNTVNHKVFGASGVIVGDTLYYIGGARYANNFPPSQYLRKGYIDPTDPTNITWTAQAEPNSKGYRMGAAEMLGKAYWLGGSDKTYNFNGIAYQNSINVLPLDRIVTYSPLTGNLTAATAVAPPVMDLRGVAKTDSTTLIIAGGMMGNQEVTNAVFILYSFPTSTDKHFKINDLLIYPNPAKDYFQVKGLNTGQVKIFNTLGQLMLEKSFSDNEEINIERLPSGMYEVLIFNKNKKYKSRILIN